MMACHHPMDERGGGARDADREDRLPMDLRIRVGAEYGLRILMLWERLQDQGLRRLLEHWSVARGDSLVPALGQIDSARLGPSLPHVWLFSRKADGELRCRLAGDALGSVFARIMAERSLGEILGEPHGAVVAERWRFVLGRPAIAHAASARPDAGSAVEHLVLPVADRSGRPAHVLGATVFDAGVAAVESHEEAAEALADPTFYLLDDRPPCIGPAVLPDPA